MDNFFDGSSFTMMECADEQNSLGDEFDKDKNSPSILDFYNSYPNCWERTKQVFNSCSSVARKNGFYSLILLHRNGGDFKKYHDLFLSNPTSLKSFGIWAMYQAIKSAELKFIEQCKTPKNEVTLTAKLIGDIDSSASLIQTRYERHLCLSDTFINLSEIELQVQNREKLTGADIGLILEWQDEHGNFKICPILLQAKRVACGLLADLSQKNEEMGYQFNILKAKKGVNSVYMFYNCDTQNVTTKPRVVTVKNIEDISFIGLPDKTSTVEDVLTLSTFMLDVMVNSVKFEIFDDRALALSSILNSLDENELASVFSLSVDKNSGAKYMEEYEQYLTFKREDESKNDSGSSSSFKP